jgi:hypothetical protein
VKVRPNRDPLYNPETDPPDDRYFQSSYPDHGVLIYATLGASEREHFETMLRGHFPDVVLIET